MRANFEKSLEAVLKHEGGFVDHPDDPGGATNKGITWRTYNAWRKRKGLAPRDVRHITADEIRAIYRVQYWDAVRGDDMPAGLDYCLFDFAVNSGPARAIKFLQRELGVEADGIIGQVTLGAVESLARVDAAIDGICDDRLRWLRGLRHWPTFGKGWARRVSEVRSMATVMVLQGKPVSSAPKPLPPTTPAEQPQSALVALFAAFLRIFTGGRA